MTMQLKHFTKQLGFIALVLFMVGPILFFTQHPFLGEWSGKNAICITVITTLFFAYTAGSLFIHRILLKQRSALLISYYLLDKILRLGLGIIMLLFYKFYVDQQLLLFAVNVFVCFSITAVLTTIYSIKAEKSEYTK